MQLEVRRSKATQNRARIDMNSRPTRVSTTLSLLPTNWALRSDQKHVEVFEADTPRRFDDEEQLRDYLRQYPESENDTASGLFKYTPSCPSHLMVALFENFNFAQFSLVPKVSTAELFRHPLDTARGVCKCDNCRTGGYCGNFALQFGITFWQYDSVVSGEQNRLEVTGGTGAFSIFAGEQ